MLKRQVKATHYRKNYDTKSRFNSYWHQIDEVLKLDLVSHCLLEIGIGNGFLSTYLKRHGVNVTTYDIDHELEPDIVGSVTEMPFTKNQFSCVLCFEVLEHIPFSFFRIALKQISNITEKYAVISLPDSNLYAGIKIILPFCLREWMVSFPRLIHRKHNFNGEHYWEIGKKGYSLSTISNIMVECGFEIIKTYRVFDHPYHRFFVLQKKTNNN